MKYKLLKDLPEYKAGEVFEDNVHAPDHYIHSLVSAAHAYPDWFEPVEEKQERNAKLSIMVETKVYGKPYSVIYKNDPELEMFTTEQVEAVSKAIESLILFIRSKDDDSKLSFDAMDLADGWLADDIWKARKLIQSSDS